MASERQREANRRNGRLGGPKTDEGKQRSRANSLRHGLCSSTLVVLPEENSQEYEEVLRGFRESFQPHHAAEDALVLRLAQAHWRSLRARRIETGMLNTTAATHRNMARKLVEDFGDRVLWGTDWPHPNHHGPIPDDGELVDVLARIAPAEAQRRRLLVDNPARLYGFS